MLYAAHYFDKIVLMLMYRCLHGTALLYLMNSYTPTATLLVVSICGLPVSGN